MDSNLKIFIFFLILIVEIFQNFFKSIFPLFNRKILECLEERAIFSSWIKLSFLWNLLFDFRNHCQICLKFLINTQAPELSRGSQARSARSGENGEGEVRSLWKVGQGFRRCLKWSIHLNIPKVFWKLPEINFVRFDFYCQRSSLWSMNYVKGWVTRLFNVTPDFEFY